VLVVLHFYQNKSLHYGHGTLGRADRDPPVTATLTRPTSAIDASQSRNRHIAAKPDRFLAAWSMHYEAQTPRSMDYFADQRERYLPGVASSPVASASAFAGFRFPPEVIMDALRWFLRRSLSYGDLEELGAERLLRCLAGHVGANRAVAGSQGV
jgi:hypothetical protein